MMHGIHRRLRKLEDSQPTAIRSERTGILRLNPDDRAFFERVMTVRITGGEFTNDAERARYHEILLGLDEE